MAERETNIHQKFTPEEMSRKGYAGVYQNQVKRIMDIVLCVIALPVFLLILLPVAVAIKLEDHGPVFYGSRRIGLGFREFSMLKFRSMKVNAPDIRNADGSTYNSATDDRVTKVGRFLRETSLDEVPQILNVLKGDMSIVGPRAGDVESRDTYAEDERDKTLVRPGITGYTQAYYRNGLGVRDKRMLDAWYAHNVSFGLDLNILFRTVKTVFMHENLYTNE